MKLKKFAVGIFAAMLFTGLAACNTANDEQEPDPTEEPSEQQQENQDNAG
ncbi:hypothetical protein [Cerasibacillus terrae]|nr:hypothetical protein [Cerasibacillus terrae]